MPIWDYRCPVCHTVVEVIRTNFADATLPAYCPTCIRVADGDVVMERLPAAPAFIMTGFTAKNGYSHE